MAPFSPLKSGVIPILSITFFKISYQTKIRENVMKPLMKVVLKFRMNAWSALVISKAAVNSP